MCLYSWDYTSNLNESEDENIKDRSHRHDKNRPKYRHGLKQIKCKNSYCMMILLFINPYMPNI